MESFFYGMLWVRGTLLFIVFKYGPMDPPEMKRSPWIKPTWSHRWEMKGGVLLCMLPCKKAVAIFGWSTDHMRVGQPPPLACGSSPLVGCMVRLSLTYLCGVGSLGGANSWSYGPSNPWAKHQHHTQETQLASYGWECPKMCLEDCHQACGPNLGLTDPT
jgi:hypothetical protein